MLTEATEFEDENFEAYLQELVWPLLRFVRVTLPQNVQFNAIGPAYIANKYITPPGCWRMRR
jgi:hypothetical protein